MSAVKVKAALETALNGMSPAISTAWENVPFSPINGVAYQQAFLQLNPTENPEFSNGYRESGILQVNLRYPINTGAAAALTRAELIRSTFKRGYSFSSGGVTVTIDKTPSIGSGAIVEDRYFLPVRVNFYANVM